MVSKIWRFQEPQVSYPYVDREVTLPDVLIINLTFICLFSLSELPHLHNEWNWLASEYFFPLSLILILTS